MIMLKQLIEKIARPGVSDLHLKPGEPPLVRHLGQLLPVGVNPMRAEDVNSIISSIITAEQRKTLEEKGDLEISQTMETGMRLRINIYRQQGRDAVVVRMIPSMPKTFTELGLPSETMDKLCRFQRGLILICGVTGAGKTTTLNAMINYMNENFSYNIITLEDSVEFVHQRKKSSISQREIHRDTPSVAEGLKYLLRQDPDVIVFGEMRDKETFKGAIEGAAAGHLVLGTVHSSDSVDAIDRIVNSFDFQEQTYVRGQLTNVISAIVAQRLVPEKTGKGQLPVTEILFGTLQMKKLLLANSPSEIKFQLEKGGAFGMHAFDQELFRLVEEDVITPDVGLNYSSNPNDFRLKLQAIGKIVSGS
jgi:twitching motility protein PilT